MNIFQVIAGIHNPSAGPTYSVGSLAHYLGKHGHRVSIVATGAEPEEWPYDCDFHLFGSRLSRSELFSAGVLKYTRHLLTQKVVLHGHGVWRAANLFPIFKNSRSLAPVVWSPRGMLTEWSMNYKSVLKKPYWNFLQKRALLKVNCFHATAQSEYDDVRRMGFSQPVAVIPNGVAIPPVDAELSVKKNRILFLSRIHPKKGLDILLEVWAALAGQFNDWELVIAGRLEGAYAKKIQHLAENLNLKNIRFAGEVLGAEKTALFQSSRLFVLPTHSENFGMVVAEALAHAVPVITTTGTPWTDLAQRSCGWVISPERKALQAVLESALRLSAEELESMGQSGRAWVEQDYSWQSVAEKMAGVYEWLSGSAHRPDYVMVG